MGGLIKIRKDSAITTGLHRAERIMVKLARRSGCHERAEHENNRSSGRGRNHGIPPEA